MRGDYSDGLIEILHLDRMQSHIDYIAIRPIARDFDSISFLDEVLCPDLDAGDKGQNCIVKNQQ